MAKFLIESGAPVDTIQSPTVNLYGEATPLFFASRRSDPEMIRMLAAHGADVNARDGNKNTPLTDCASHASPETVRALLAVGAHVNALGIYDLTALHQAAQPIEPRRCGFCLPPELTRQSVIEKGRRH